MMQFFEASGCWGDSQFAYRKGHSAQDVLAYVCTSWLLALQNNFRIGVYCSDIKGAFDRVCTALLLFKCAWYGLPEKAIRFLEAYLSKRSAQVVVGGHFSEMFDLSDQVFQGTVLGPKLWNTFFADIRFVVQSCGLTDLLFADDLNAFQIFDRAANNDEILEGLKRCQSKCHEWGRANQVEFESTKESFCIIDRSSPFGDGF